ncbi:MAG: VWA domain-containing protein [Polyangiaceae bacterium]
MRVAPFRAVLIATSLLFAACAPAKGPTARSPVVTTAAMVEPAPRIEVAGAVTPSLIRIDKDQEVTVRVRVHGLPLTNKKRPPLDLALVLDTSGSMEGKPMDDARAACSKLIDLVGDGDFVSIVTFGSHAKVIVPAVRVDKESRAKAKLALRNIAAQGTTDMTAGLAEGLTQINAPLATNPEMSNAIRRIVLVGDGVPNDAPSVLALADNAGAQHVPVTVLGLGNDFDETLMTALAQRSSGTFHFVDDASRVAVVFQEQISRMERVVARGARIELTPGPGVTITELVGIPSSTNGHVQVAGLGDLVEGQTRDVFVRVAAKGRQDGSSIELLDAQVSYTLPESGAAELSSSVFLKSGASSDAARLHDAVVMDVEHGATSMRVADGIVKAIASAREGDVPGARKILDAAIRLAKEGKNKFADESFTARVTEMSALRKTLPSLAPQSASMSKPDSPDKAAAQLAPRPAASAPAEAMELRAAHGDAMKALQGE